jgi:hypothetical protein
MEIPGLLEVAHVFSRLECKILAFARDLVEVGAERGSSSEKIMQLCLRIEETR